MKLVITGANSIDAFKAMDIARDVLSKDLSCTEKWRYGPAHGQLYLARAKDAKNDPTTYRCFVWKTKACYNLDIQKEIADEDDAELDGPAPDLSERSDRAGEDSGDGHVGDDNSLLDGTDDQEPARLAATPLIFDRTSEEQKKTRFRIGDIVVPNRTDDQFYKDFHDVRFAVRDVLDDGADILVVSNLLLRPTIFSSDWFDRIEEA